MSVPPEAIEKMMLDYAKAWNSGDAKQVASFYEPDGWISINGGAPYVGHTGLEEMAGGFMAAFPGMRLFLDFSRSSCDRALFCWTLEGVHKESGNLVKISGWEAWLLSSRPGVKESLGYFDAEDFERQVSGGG